MILVGGENLIDLIEDTNDETGKGFRAALGGSCYNCAMALGRLGGNVAYTTPISTDGFGQRLAAGLEASGVSLVGDRVANPTSMAVVTLHNGQPSYQFYREGTAERSIDTASQIALLGAGQGTRSQDRVSMFHIGSLALIDGADADAWVEVLAHAKSNGITTTLDPNVRPTMIADRAGYLDRLYRAAAVADVIKLSDEDLGWIFPDTDVEEAFDRFVEKTGAYLTVLTLGPDGALMRFKGQQLRVDGVAVEGLADTVGAGDTFMGALLTSIDHVAGSEDWREMDADKLAAIGRFACEAAAINCTREGCNPPTRGEVKSAAAVFS